MSWKFAKNTDPRTHIYTKYSAKIHFPIPHIDFKFIRCEYKKKKTDYQLGNEERLIINTYLKYSTTGC